MIFQRESPLKGIGTGIGKGINRAYEEKRDQDAINQIIQRVKEGDNYLDAIMESRLPYNSKRELTKDLGDVRKKEQESQLNFLKAQTEYLKQKGNTLLPNNRDAMINQIKNSKLNIPEDTLSNLSDKDLQAAYSQSLKPSESPLDKGFATRVQQDQEKIANLQKRLSDTKRQREVVKQPGTSIGNFTNYYRSLTEGTRLQNIIPPNADAAELNYLVVSGAPELKNSFGARVTNFDFAKWLEGQPSTNKTMATNLALATLIENATEMEVELAGLSVLAAQLFPNDSAQAYQWMNEKQNEIREKYDKKVIQELENIPKELKSERKKSGVVFREDKNAKKRKQSLNKTLFGT